MSAVALRTRKPKRPRSRLLHSRTGEYLAPLDFRRLSRDEVDAVLRFEQTERGGAGRRGRVFEQGSPADRKRKDITNDAHRPFLFGSSTIGARHKTLAYAQAIAQ